MPALSPATIRSYAAIWDLFTDWCDVAGEQPLPADPINVLAFLADCPVAPATRRRRVIAIDHHHTASGHRPPGMDPAVRQALGRPSLERAPTAPEIRAQVGAALRVLPSRGWVGGLFGRRDRCLLVLSQLAGIPHRHLAGLTAGAVTLADGTATITAAGDTYVIDAVDDPVLCGPCAIAQWLEVQHTIVTRIATRAVAELVDDDEAKDEPRTAVHACEAVPAIDQRSAGEPLLIPINQWGHAPFPPDPMTPHAVSRQSRDLLGGLVPVHRILPVPGRPPADETIPRNQLASPRTGYGPEQYRAALDRRRADLVKIADIADEFSAVDQAATELDQRIRQLLALSAGRTIAADQETRHG